MCNQLYLIHEWTMAADLQAIALAAWHAFSFVCGDF